MPRLLFVVLLMAPLAADGQSARLHVLADSVSIGAPFEIAVTVSRQPGHQVIFTEPPLGASRLSQPLQVGDAELLALRRYPPATRDGLRVDSAVYSAAVFAIDSARVGPVAVRLVAAGDTQLVTTAAHLVPVRSLAPPDAEELVGPSPLAEFPRSVWPWVVGAAVLLALLAAAAIFLIRRSQTAGGAEADDEHPADQAVRRLNVLAAASPSAPDEVRDFFVELSDTLRTYISRTFSIPARELTTRELQRALSRAEPPLPHEALEATLRCLLSADLVKFAGERPPAGKRDDAVRDARLAVDAFESERLRLEAELESEIDPTTA